VAYFVATAAAAAKTASITLFQGKGLDMLFLTE
jgi:hypothetical protein